MTETQRILLGLMVKLENCELNIIYEFISLAEKRILTEKKLQFIDPVTRLYVACCMYKRDIYRIRRFICDAAYIMEDLFVPFMFAVLISWPEVIPYESESEGTLRKLFSNRKIICKIYNFILDVTLERVIVQVILSKTCNLQGYNLLNLQLLLNVHHKYPKERWNSEELLKNLLEQLSSNFFLYI